jgi:hypothetical protein
MCACVCACVNMSYLHADVYFCVPACLYAYLSLVCAFGWCVWQVTQTPCGRLVSAQGAARVRSSGGTRGRTMGRTTCSGLTAKPTSSEWLCDTGTGWGRLVVVFRLLCAVCCVLCAVCCVLCAVESCCCCFGVPMLVVCAWLVVGFGNRKPNICV